MNMTPQAASQALRRARPHAMVGGIGMQMQQLAIDFESSNLITDAIEAESMGSVPHLLETPVESKASSDGLLDLSLDNGSYVQLAINLLLTCAEDLVAAEKVLARTGLHKRTLNTAVALKNSTVRWLCDDVENAAFSFSDCVTLLEDELRFQSMGQIAMPAIAARSSELSDWILNDPHTAKDVLGRYLTIFSRNDEEYTDLDSDLDDDSGYERTRPRA